jgi:hypothetical protein
MVTRLFTRIAVRWHDIYRRPWHLARLQSHRIRIRNVFRKRTVSRRVMDD